MPNLHRYGASSTSTSTPRSRHDSMRVLRTTITTISPTSSTPTALPVPTPSFEFNSILRAETCTAVAIIWTYTGPDELVTFVVGSIIDLEAPDPGPNESLIQVATNVDATVQSFTWPSVFLSSGVYMLEAQGTGIMAKTQLLVLNGTDTSCAVIHVPMEWDASSSASSHTVSEASMVPITKPVSTTSATSTASTTSSTATPSPSVSTSTSGTNGGALAGGIVIAVLIAVGAVFLAAYLYARPCRRFRLRNRTAEQTRSRRPAMDERQQPALRSPLSPAPLPNRFGRGKWVTFSSQDTDTSWPVDAAGSVSVRTVSGSELATVGGRPPSVRRVSYSSPRTPLSPVSVASSQASSATLVVKEELRKESAPRQSGMVLASP